MQVRERYSDFLCFFQQPEKEEKIRISVVPPVPVPAVPAVPLPAVPRLEISCDDDGEMEEGEIIDTTRLKELNSVLGWSLLDQVEADEQKWQDFDKNQCVSGVFFQVFVSVVLEQRMKI